MLWPMILLALVIWIGAAVLIGKCIALSAGRHPRSPWPDDSAIRHDEEAEPASRRGHHRVRFSKLS